MALHTTPSTKVGTCEDCGTRFVDVTWHRSGAYLCGPCADRWSAREQEERTHMSRCTACGCYHSDPDGSTDLCESCASLGDPGRD